MKSIFGRLFRKSFYEQIPYNDLMSRQRFTLFRIYSFTGFLASIGTAIQSHATFDEASTLAVLLVLLAGIIMGNFFLVNKQEKLPVAYAISLIAGFLVVHIQAYNAGGVLNTGTMYMCAIIMTAFMLLGSKAGKWFTGLAIANVIFLFCMSEYTTFTSYDLLKNDIHLIYQDALTTFILALTLVAAQSNYLHSGKNVIIERITLQRDQLEITNKKLQEYTVSLEKTNRELDKFASIVSHDLKAPLRAIGNLTGWIEEDAGPMMNEETRTNFNMIKGRVRRMEDLIDAILAYSRADRTQGQISETDVHRLIIETMEFIGSSGSHELNIKGQMPVLMCDKTRLSQVFSNLFENAIKYGVRDDLKIDVSVQEQADGYVFSVRDNGPGIDKQYHDKIFVIFQTLNRRDDVESTGVGLAIVKKIIEEQGGKIWVESEPGQGADFRFFWPKEIKPRDAALIAAPIIV